MTFGVQVTPTSSLRLQAGSARKPEAGGPGSVAVALAAEPGAAAVRLGPGGGHLGRPATWMQRSRMPTTGTMTDTDGHGVRARARRRRRGAQALKPEHRRAASGLPVWPSQGTGRVRPARRLQAAASAACQ